MMPILFIETSAGRGPASKELRDHLLPPGPIVTRAVSPNIQPMWNALTRHDLRQSAVVAQADVILAGRQYHPHTAVLLQNRRVCEVGKKIRRAVEIAVVVVVAVQELV